MPSVYDVAIIGGGVIGLTTAYYLARDGMRVVVVDKGQPGQEASWAGAGILSPGNPRRAKSPLGRLKALSAALWPELSNELKERIGLDNGYVCCGGLELRRTADELESKRIENVLREERGEGVDCEVLDGRQLRELEPVLSADLPGAVFFPGVGQVRNPWHLKALLSACKALGVTFYTDAPVHAIRQADTSCVGIETSAGVLEAQNYLLAAGAWSAALGSLLGAELPVRPIRGQIVLLNCGGPRLSHVLQAGSQYVVPRTDGMVLVGSTEEDVGYCKKTTAEGIGGLLNFVHGMVPGLMDAHVERCWAGLRPGSLDGKPYLGRISNWDNVFVATGHYRSGLTLSPATGRVMAEVILGKEPSMPLDPFRMDRPRPPECQARTDEYPLAE